MRQLIVTAGNIDAAYRSDYETLVLTGEDEASGELVTFRATPGQVADLSKFRARTFVRDDPAADITVSVEDAHVLRVITGPVRGEWDSPGTSPEEEGA